MIQTDARMMRYFGFIVPQCQTFDTDGQGQPTAQCVHPANHAGKCRFKKLSAVTEDGEFGGYHA